MQLVSWCAAFNHWKETFNTSYFGEHFVRLEPFFCLRVRILNLIFMVLGLYSDGYDLHGYQLLDYTETVRNSLLFNSIRNYAAHWKGTIILLNSNCLKLFMNLWMVHWNIDSIWRYLILKFGRGSTIAWSIGSGIFISSTGVPPTFVFSFYKSGGF